MASLIEELIRTMDLEDGIYKELIPIEKEKTKVIIDNDLTALQDITAKEQEVIEKINSLERKREEVIVNIGTVLNRDPKTLNVKTLTKLMAAQPDITNRLAVVYDSLNTTVKSLMSINERNRVLLEQSLEMIDFNMNLLQSMRSAPGISNYDTRGAEQDMSGIYRKGSFDTKQ
ncbi:MAG: flagellar protein FlgN [Lachnospiraceae bacterium]|nr:flagellar protein FlgN [Lachnospiraceae bacterium]